MYLKCRQKWDVDTHTQKNQHKKQTKKKPHHKTKSRAETVCLL